MSVRIHITVPDEVGARLSRWAEKQGRPTANLASHLVEVAVKDATASGEIPPDPIPEPDTNSGSVLSPILKAAISNLIDGEALSPDEEVQIAKAVGKAPHNVHNASKKIRRKEGNGDAKPRTRS